MSKLALSLVLLGLGVASCLGSPFLKSAEEWQSGAEQMQDRMLLGDGPGDAAIAFEVAAAEDDAAAEPQQVFVVATGEPMRTEQQAMELVRAAAESGFEIRAVDGGQVIPLSGPPEWQGGPGEDFGFGDQTQPIDKDPTVLLGSAELLPGRYELAATGLPAEAQIVVMANPMSMVLDLIGGTCALLGVGTLLFVAGLVLLIVTLASGRSKQRVTDEGV